MQMKLLKIISIVSSLIVFSFATNINENNLSKIQQPVISIDNGNSIKSLKKEIENNKKNILINKGQIISNIKNLKNLENKISKVKKDLNQSNVLLTLTELKKENTLLKKAMAKMILDIVKLKKINSNLYFVNTKIINTRSCPSINCSVVRSRYKGDVVIVKNKVGDWYQTISGNYIYYKLLTKVQ